MFLLRTIIQHQQQQKNDMQMYNLNGGKLQKIFSWKTADLQRDDDQKSCLQ